MVDAKTNTDLWVLPLEGDRKPMPLLRTAFNDGSLESPGQFSPDGRWIAYLSNESGRNEVYVRAFSPAVVAGSPEAGSKWLISRGASASGRIKWRGDGKELTYVASDGKVMAVEVTTTSEFSFGEPKSLFSLPPGVLRMDQTADGQRWLVAVPVALSTPTPFTVVLNWQTGLTRTK